MQRAWSGTMLVISTAMVLGACSSGSNDKGAGAAGSNGQAGAGGTTGGGGASAGTTGAAGATAGGTGTAGAGGTGTGGTGTGNCNTLTVSGNFIPERAATGTPPAPAGGAIANGTYVLTKVDVYTINGATLETTTLKGTFRVTGSQLEMVTQTGTSAAATRTNYSLSTTAGTYLVFTPTCPDVGPATMIIAYTATSSALLTFDGGPYDVKTYTKQ